MKTLLSTAGAQAPAASQVPDLLPRGAKAGPWIVERELGRGGMGAVYAVVHEEIGKRAALKVVHGRLLGAGFNPERMLVEARVVNQVGHPNIVDIFETGNLPDGRPYIVMERLEGQSLAHRADQSQLPPELTCVILRQICDALIAAHAAGVVHRDLKLDNVFLVDNLEDPSTPKVKILDWGIAKIVHEDVRHTMEGQLVGTPQYLSPEQARGGKVSEKTDVYSLGVMAYELFLDQLPFEAETSAEIMAMHLRATPAPPHELWPDIPQDLEALILQMLEKRADHRPTMLEVATRLEAVLKELQERRCSGEIPAPAKPASISKPIPVPPMPASLPIPLQAQLSARALRRMSAEAHAPTRHASARPRARYWRYAAGGLAIAGCVALFLVSRGGDQLAAAAPAAAAALEAMPAVTAPAPVAARAVAAPAAIQLVELTESPRPTDRTVEEHALPTPAPKAAAPHAAKPAAAGRHAELSPIQSRRAPAAPRRAKIDPDGTIDPY
jgi:serine/threonine protein kinase